MAIRLNGSTSGYIEIDAPAVAGTTAITLPATSGGNFVVTDSAGDLNIDSGTFFVDASTNRVGVGTTSPTYAFHVAGNTSSPLGMFAQTDSNASKLVFQPVNGANGALINADWTTGSGYLALGAGGEKVRINSSGNVGVGTTSFPDPGAGLNLANGFLYLYDPQDATDAGRSIKFATNGGATGRAQVEIKGLQNASGTGGGYFTVLTMPAGGTSRQERLRITADGKVGVGTTSPSQKMHLEDSGSNVYLRITETGNTGIDFGQATDGNGVINLRDSAAIQILTGGTERARIDSSGRLLVGTSSNSAEALLTVQGRPGDGTSYARLDLQRGSTTITSGADLGEIQFTDSNVNRGAEIAGAVDGTWTAGSAHPTRLVFSTCAAGTVGPTERMRIAQNGNVGIGTTTTNWSLLDGLIVQTGNGSAGVNIASSSSAHNAYLAFGYGTSHADQFSAFVGRTGDDTLALGTANTQRMRITNAGWILVEPSNVRETTPTFSQWAGNQSNKPPIEFYAKHSSFANNVIQVIASRAQSSLYSLIKCWSNNAADVEFNLRGDGNAYADGSWSGGGADYAEYFEWSDGNTAAEDRRGISVVLDGDKIREAVAGEEPIGVISGNPSVVGDADIDRWKGKYLRDDYGTYIQEDYDVEDEDGNTVVQQRRKLNPDYDPDAEYVSREDRPEWDCVGLMGKLRIRKGQVTGARWIKMRDISDNVEEWLVR